MNDFGLNAGGALRVSQMLTLIDGKVIGSDDSQLFENVGTGTAAFSNNKVNLSVASGQYTIRQTKRFAPYFSGKSQIVEMTFDNFQTQANTVKRVGYFSSGSVAPYDSTRDGFYIENNNGSFSLKAERAGNVTVNVPFEIMDNFDEIQNYDWSKFTVIAFDFLWLGGAVLRFFVKTQNGFVLVHTVNYSGTSTDTFTLSPNQPIRYEIRSTGGAGSLRYVCSQVATEGSINEGGNTLSVINYSAITTNNIGKIYALKGIKKQAAFRDVAIQIINIALTLGATSDSGVLMLLKNPTLSAPLTYVNKEKIQEGTATNQTITVNTGRLIVACPVSQSGGETSAMKENFLSFLTSSITGSIDEFILAYMPSTTNQTVQGIITIKEF